MFETPDRPHSLDEDTFESWFEKGRESKISYAYILIVWDEIEEKYYPVYLEERAEIEEYRSSSEFYARQKLIAVYDLYSESRIF